MLLVIQRMEFRHARRTKQAVKDASHLYEVERRARHCERPGFRITEIQLSPTQTVPWHTHTQCQRHVLCAGGRDAPVCAEPEGGDRAQARPIYAVAPGRPHLVTNAGARSMTFLVLQGVGEYDYVPMV